MIGRSSPQLSLIDALRYGAIGISFICLILAFLANQNLTRDAQTLPERTLTKLLAHAKWTMAFSFACLVAAIAIEFADRWAIPVTMRISVVPPIDVGRLHYLRAQPLPVHVQVGADAPIELSGSQKLLIPPDTTLLVDVDGMWEAVKDLDGDLYGQQKRTSHSGGVVEPKR
jgi:hypothetical protein